MATLYKRILKAKIANSFQAYFKESFFAQKYTFCRFAETYQAMCLLPLKTYKVNKFCLKYKIKYCFINRQNLLNNCLDYQKKIFI